MPRIAAPRDLAWQQQVGFRLACARKAIQPSQSEAAQAAGVRRTASGHYESGRRIVDVEAATRFSLTFHISLDWVYGGKVSALSPSMARSIRDRSSED